MNIVLALAAGVTAAAGTWLVLGRTILRVILGVTLLGHATVLLLLTGAAPIAAPPFSGDPLPVTDPLPQALGLTAIVITFAIVGFLLALLWRSRAVLGDDVIRADDEDVRIASRADSGQPREHAGDPTADAAEDVSR